MNTIISIIILLLSQAVFAKITNLGYGEQCSDSKNRWDKDKGLLCPNSNRQSCPTSSNVRSCDCPAQQFYDDRDGGSGNCRTLLENGESCTLDCQCSTPLTCQSGICSCIPPLYWTGSKCDIEFGASCQNQNQVVHGVPCTGTPSNECNDANSLTCQSSVCECTSDKYWDGTCCVPKLEHSSTCTGTPSNECNGANSLTLWNAVAYFRLSVVEPSGYLIYWGQTGSTSGGIWEGDGIGANTNGNIYWPQTPASGTYTVQVIGLVGISFTVIIIVNGQINYYDNTRNYSFTIPAQ